jgi:hypothetical protein
MYIGSSVRKLFIRYNGHINSAKWKKKTSVGKHIFQSKHQINISDLKLLQEVRQKWKIEFYEAIHIHKNLLNSDDGPVRSSILKFFLTERKVDQNFIDLTDQTDDEDEFFDCT